MSLESFWTLSVELFLTLNVERFRSLIEEPLWTLMEELFWALIKELFWFFLNFYWPFEYQLFLSDSILKYQILIVRQPKKHVYMSSIFSLSNAGRMQTSEYKITFLEFGCLSSAYCNCTWLFIVFWVVIIWIIHSWLWFVE